MFILLPEQMLEMNKYSRRSTASRDDWRWRRAKVEDLWPKT
jgi:hypothetical protein